MANTPLSEQDPGYHTQNASRMMQELIDHLRQDVDKVDDPQAKALFEVSAKVVGDLKRAFEHLGTKPENAWK